MRDGLPVSEDCAIDFHRRTLRSIESAAASQSARFWQQHLPRKSSRGFRMIFVENALFLL